MKAAAISMETGSASGSASGLADGTAKIAMRLHC